jgi:hypothetical protein
MSISSGAVALRLADISNLVPGDRVVCMFDSSEGSTENKNPLSGIVAESLARQGYRVEWLDVANGPPAPGIVAGARAVVTGFKDGKIGRARDLVEFLREVANAGVRVVVIGAFGAFQDSDGAFLPANVVNRFFLAIGVNYEAWWTDEPAKFSVRVEDQALGLPQAVTSSATRHFYQFSSMRPDVHVQVSGQRTDSELPPSALVFTSATGAMALSRYLSGDDMLADARQSRLDINAFVSEALGRRPADPTTLLVVVDPTVSDSRRALESIRQAASYCGIPLATMTVGAASTLRPIDLAAYAGLVLAVPEVPAPLDDYLAGLVKDLLSRKGRALSVLPVRNKPLAVVFGHDGSAPPVPYKASKVRFTAAAFPGLGGFLIDLPEPSLSGLRAALPSRCTVMVHAVVSDGEVPMWWRCPVGGGEVSVLNAYELTDRASLGFVIQALLDVEGSFAMPVLDAAVEFVDDCPLPMTGSVLPVLGKLDTTFYRDDFYGAVRDLAKRLGIRPTFLAVFTYDDKVSAPYGEPWPGPTGEVSRELASRIVADDFPAGLHGMTHVSPGLSGGVTRPFADESALMNQLQAARHAYSQVFGAENFPIVYVPPNDWIDAAGKRALVAAVPEVRVLASVFVGSDVETQQDFGPDPDQPSLVALPRTWAGMTLAGDPAMGMVNGLLAQVTSTHFIHPDDVLDKERSGGLLWAGLRDSWIRSMDEMRRRFPYLREMTAVQAADEVRRMSATGLKVVASGQAGVSMTRASGIDGSMIVLVRLPAGCRASADAGGKVVLTDPASGRHLVRMDRRKLVVGCERGSAEPTRALAAR